MEFPHHHHHHHHNRHDDEEERDPYAPPPPGVNFAAPPSPYDPQPHFSAAPPPPFPGDVTHVHHASGDPYPPPGNSYEGYEVPPPPPNPILESHGGDFGGVTNFFHHHSHQTNMASVFHHRHDEDENRLPENIAGLAGRPTVKVYSKADPNYYLTIRGGKVLLAPSDPSDEAQHWYKDEKYSTIMRDSEGCPCFALVNKATGEAMKHSVGETQPVQLIPYEPDKLDEAVLWTESKDFGDGFRTIRMVNNTHMNVDAYHGDHRSGGIRDGTLIVLWKWNKGDNQLWKIVPFCKFFSTF